MKEFTRQNLKSLRKEIEAALNEVGQKNGIALSMGNIRFSGSEFRAKLEAAVGNPVSKEQKQKEALKEYGSMFGLSEKDYGKTFVSNGDTFKLVGLLPNRRKYPIVGQSLRTGKEFIFTERVIEKLK